MLKETSIATFSALLRKFSIDHMDRYSALFHIFLSIGGALRQAVIRRLWFLLFTNAIFEKVMPFVDFTQICLPSVCGGESGIIQRYFFVYSRIFYFIIHVILCKLGTKLA